MKFVKMSENEDLIAAIRAKDIEKIKELAQADTVENAELKQYWPNSFAFKTAIWSKNLNVIKTLVDIWTTESNDTKAGGLCALHDLPLQKFSSDEEKMSVLEYLLPHLFWEDPKRPGFFEVDMLFSFIPECWQFCSLYTNYFLQNYYYSEEHNSLYPLIKKLQELKVDERHVISILLHSDIEHFGDIGIDTILEEIVAVFLKLILGTPEMMKLAIEILKILIEKKIEYSVKEFAKCVCDSFFEDDEEDDEEIEEKEIIHLSPMLLKRMFQLIFCVFDPKHYMGVMSLMKCWIKICCLDKSEFYQSCQVYVPFITHFPFLVRDIFKKIDAKGSDKFRKLFEQFDDESPTLRNKCQRKIWNIIAEAANFSLQELFERVWSLPLPETVKCEMLHLPDASWMNDLPDFD